MIEYFVKHPTAANLLMLLLMVIGFIALPDLQRETFPDFTASEVQISIAYPGAAPADVEEAICGRLEDAIDGIQYLHELRCQALENRATAVAEMAETGDLTQFVDDINTEVDAIDDFPLQAELPVIEILGRSDPVVALALFGNMPVTDLKHYAEWLKDQIKQHTEVSQIDIQGFSERQLRIELDLTQLRRYGLSVADVSNTLQDQSVDLPAGSLETTSQDILLRFTEERRTPAQLAELVIISNDSGAAIRLGALARIDDVFELDEAKILFNGQRAALLQISKTDSQDSLDIFAQVTAFVETLRPTLPPGVQLELTQDMASIVADRLQMLVKNGWQGLILVALTLWLFFSFRFSLWVVMGLPVSFLGTFFFMQLLGLSLNMLTMVGLLIALGLLMDDGIVIAENIASHYQRGKAAWQAATDGVKEVSVGVVSSFFTTLSMFGPLAFIEGDIGKVLKVMPIVLILTLAVSLIEAFLILPHHLAHSLEGQKTDRFHQAFETGLAWVRENILGRAVDWAVNWRYVFAASLFAILLAMLGLVAGGTVKFQGFPSIEGDLIEARILLPQGTPLARTEQVVTRVTEALAELDQAWPQPQGQSLVNNVRVDFNKNLTAQETGAHVATVSVDLLSTEQRTTTIDEIISDWRQRVGTVPDVLSIQYQEPSVGPAGLAIEILLSGSDLAELSAASQVLQGWLNGYIGVYNLLDDLRPGKPELRLTLKDGALALGFTAQSVANQLRAAYFGTTAAEIQVDAESYEVLVRLAEHNRDSLMDLDRFVLTRPTGEQVPLSAVVVMTQARGYARIQRIDGVRTVTVQGDVDTRVANAAEIIADLQQQFLPELQQQYPDVQVQLAGEVAESGTTGQSIGYAFLLGIVGIFILLSFQFRSYLEPLTVMLAIPLGLIGVIGGHYVMGLDLSMPSMMGFVSLAGIVVNDSILLVVFLKMRVQQGALVHDAAKQASRDRFRAVLLTSLTTIAGLLPLLAETSVQAQVLIPLVTSLAFGLMASTVLVLLMIPALYTILEDWGLARAN